MSEDWSGFHEAAAASLPPGVAPSFGLVPETHFEDTPHRLVLSSEAHRHLAQTSTVSDLSGKFTLERVGSGMLSIHETEAPGEIRLHADVETLGGPNVTLDARVRESWVVRTAAKHGHGAGNVRVVNELIRLAGIPHQSTVTVNVEAD